MEGLKTSLNTAMGGVVTWINASVSMTSINDGMAILVGLLTAIYLICQINKALRKTK